MTPTVSYLFGSFIAGKYSDDLVKYENDKEIIKEKENIKERKMKEKKSQEKGEVTQKIEEENVVYKFPVMRIKVAFYSSLLVPLFIAAFGWLVQNKVHIVVPLICSFIGKFK